jgi:alpha-beta hydrolase superfamily lysophospholipase
VASPASNSRLGVLLLHGYTSSLDTVNGMVPTLTRLGLPYRMPVLRGHGTHERDLRGVTAADWYADASAALNDLLREVPRAAVVGPYASVGAGTSISEAIVRDCIIGEQARVRATICTGTLIGDRGVVEGAFQTLNIGDDSALGVDPSGAIDETFK